MPKDLGVEFVLNFVVGCSETIDELFGDGYEAVSGRPPAPVR